MPLIQYRYNIRVVNRGYHYNELIVLAYILLRLSSRVHINGILYIIEYTIVALYGVQYPYDGVLPTS